MKEVVNMNNQKITIKDFIAYQKNYANRIETGIDQYLSEETRRILQTAKENFIIESDLGFGISTCVINLPVSTEELISDKKFAIKQLKKEIADSGKRKHQVEALRIFINKFIDKYLGEKNSRVCDERGSFGVFDYTNFYDYKAMNLQIKTLSELVCQNCKQINDIYESELEKSEDGYIYCDEFLQNLSDSDINTCKIEKIYSKYGYDEFGEYYISSDISNCEQHLIKILDCENIVDCVNTIYKITVDNYYYYYAPAALGVIYEVSKKDKEILDNIDLL